MDKEIGPEPPVERLPPEELFKKLLKENNLVVTLSTPPIRYLTDGAILVEEPTVLVDYGKKTT